MFLFLVFLAWVYRTRKNLPGLGATDLRFTPGWAVGSFFVPIVNLVAPAQILHEIRLWSDPSMEQFSDESSKPRRKRDLIVGFWWRLYVVSLALQWISRSTVEGFYQGIGVQAGLMLKSFIVCISDAFAVPAAILAIVMVHRINTGQWKKFCRIRQAGAITDET
jgi:hypothetical protein